jgi:hypothetical protein
MRSSWFSCDAAPIIVVVIRSCDAQLIHSIIPGTLFSHIQQGGLLLFVVGNDDVVNHIGEKAFCKSPVELQVVC